MKRYLIKDYQNGFEPQQAYIGLEVARKWIWPYAYHLEGLLKVHAQPDFDPETRHYCFLDDEMVGYMFSHVTPAGGGIAPTANLDFPHMLPGHEQAAELLIEKAFETLRKKGVSHVEGRVTTMCPGDVQLAQKMGFTIHDWGYKVYYSYEMEWGKLDVAGDAVEEANPEKNLKEYAQIAARWYKRPAEWCQAHLRGWHSDGVIAHVGVREQGRLVAACMAAPNDVRPSTAAIFYIYVPDAQCLKPMLATVVNKCIDFGAINLIVDLVNEHRPYEPVYQELGFRKVAEWARCEKLLE